MTAEHDTEATRKFIAVAEPLLSRAHQEALRSRRETLAVRTTLADLVVAIVLEGDILAHLIEARELTVSLRAFREKRSGRPSKAADITPEQAVGPATLRLVANGEPLEIGESPEIEQVVQDVLAWIGDRSPHDDFGSWEPHSFRGDLSAKVMDAMTEAMQFPSDEMLEQSSKAGLSHDQVRQMFRAMVEQPQADTEWRAKLSERNFRYAVLRELFERSRIAQPDEIESTLSLMGVSVRDVMATFDSLAMSFGWRRS